MRLLMQDFKSMDGNEIMQGVQNAHQMYRKNEKELYGRNCHKSFKSIEQAQALLLDE